jgi:hypothetical protein
MASSGRRDDILDSSVYLAEHHPWLVGVYQEAIDLIHDAGFKFKADAKNEGDHNQSADPKPPAKDAKTREEEHQESLAAGLCAAGGNSPQSPNYP